METVYEIHVVTKEEFLIIVADIYYTFWDEYKDPADIGNWNPFFDIEIPGGAPYKITDVWSTRLEAVIKKDVTTSKF